MLSSLRTAPQSRFEEQFKYDVISSNLLSSSLPAPSCARRNAQDTLHVPGHLRSSRETSEDEGAIDITDAPTPSAPAPNSDSVAVAALNSAYLPPSLVAAAAVLALVDAYGIAVLLLSAALYFAYERGQMAFKSRQDPSSIVR
ncbi:hypothetical protein OE88DRAFT_532383 [Heliocybe sulcata]|uniref:Uncharacterized protein n=1 Tax=Heliocybe sulcata TaxID=5364 RepID=A0A5C3MU61_9AGAM|nr:hypothetical protein OE88DRAFT_532383 [Heliocybe sulcata]